MVALFNPALEQASWKVLAQGVAEFDIDAAERERRISSLIATMLATVPE